MMNLPNVSVIIPCYNHSQYVLNCLESTLNAYEGTLEVIICDDASQDNSADLIRSFADEHLHHKNKYIFIQNEINSGVCKTLNRCLERVSNEIVYIIASDDFISENGLTQAIHFLIEKDADAVISDCHVVNEHNQTVAESAFFDFRKGSLKKLSGNIKNELVFNWIVPGPALLLKKSVFNDIGQYDTSLMAEDRDFYLRLLSQKTVIFNNAKVASYRIHSNNLSRTDVFKEKAHQEFSFVNFKNHANFNGLARLYLKSYYLDTRGKSGYAVYIRKLIKLIYILF